MRFFFGLFMYAYLGASIFVILHTMDVLRPFKVKWGLMALYILISFSLLIGRGFGDRLPLEVSAFLTRLGYFWISLLTFMFIWSIVWLVLRLFKIGPVSPQGRLIFFFTEIFLLLVVFIIGYVQANRIQVVRFELEANNWQWTADSETQEEPLKIVQISDIHLGIMNSRRKFTKIVKKIAQLEPDIVLITGDFFENEHSYAEIKDIGAPLRDLQPKYGIWAVMGNHEYIANVDKSLNYMQSLGVQILRDEATIIDDKILLIGRDDQAKLRRTGVRHLSLNNLLKKEMSFDADTLSTINDQIATNKYLPILMTHQTQVHNIYEDRGFFLVLSGHTHAGQFIPYTWIVNRQYEIAYGYQKRGETHIYVTSGTSYWGPPFRLGTKSEIVLFEVRSE